MFISASLGEGKTKHTNDPFRWCKAQQWKVSMQESR